MKAIMISEYGNTDILQYALQAKSLTIAGGNLFNYVNSREEIRRVR